MRVIRGIVIGTVLGIVLAAGLQDAAARDCNASLSINRQRVEQETNFTRYVFAIDVSVADACAIVEFNVILETRAPGQDPQTVKKYRKVRYRTQQLTTGHTYTTAPGVDVVSWRVEQISCQACE